MTVIEQTENLRRDLEGLKRSDEQTAAREEVIRRLSSLAQNLHILTSSGLTLYESASVLTQEFESSELALAVWEDLHKNATRVLAMLERAPRLEPGLDSLIEESRGIFRNLVHQSAEAIIEWDAQAEADGGNPVKPEGSEMSVPNTETIAAIEEGKRDDLKSFNTVAELMADLNAED